LICIYYLFAPPLFIRNDARKFVDTKNENKPEVALLLLLMKLRNNYFEMMTC